MDTEPSNPRPRRARQLLATAALAGGMAVGGYGIAHAATSSSSSSASNSSTAAAETFAPARPQFNPLDGSHAGPGETLLTGDSAAKATAAAKAAVPGGTMIRVETDANQGAKYEAHMQKRDGSDVTVLMDSNYKVTSVVPFGPGAGGPHGAPQGQPSA